MKNREKIFEIDLDAEMGQVWGTTSVQQRNYDIVGHKSGLELSFVLKNKGGEHEKNYKCKFKDSMQAHAEGTWSSEDATSKSGSFTLKSLRPKPLDVARSTSKPSHAAF